MNPLGVVGDRLSTRVVYMVGTLVGLAAFVVIARVADWSAFAAAIRRAAGDPIGIGVSLVSFATAFALRARAWTIVVPSLGFWHSLSAIHVALGGNHVLPFRLGEPLRVVSAVRRSRIGLEVATASTVTLRAVDMLTVVAVGLLAAPVAIASVVGPVGWGLLAIIAVVAAGGHRWIAGLARRLDEVRAPGPGVVALAMTAWLSESVLVWQSAQWAGLDVSWSHAVVVTAAAVAAQIAAFAPGGFGTYEAASVAAYVSLGHDADAALVAAIGAHALKTAYSIVTGAAAVVWPAPTLLGRLRVGSTGELEPDSGRPEPDAPIMLFMPAHDEELAVGTCIARVPETVAGRQVQVVVIDDGSTDRTTAVALAAGAEVVRQPENLGLGAAVRTGLQLAADREVAAVAFCDADGEYPPEELETLVVPILEGRADYVAGSRFLGRIDHMQHHRRLGNVVLSRVLSLIARRRITDGQTGYRAFSLRAATSAEIIHDFNYAQVLTLDLLAKGFPYEEVPISYRFRTAGSSFVKLVPYLRRVVPAVYRELNAR